MSVSVTDICISQRYVLADYSLLLLVAVETTKSSRLAQILPEGFSFK